MGVVSALGTAISIGNNQLPCFSWSVDVGAYGQIGRASIRTTITALKRAGLSMKDLRTGSTQAGGDQGLQLSTPDILIYEQGDTVFGGQYLHGFFAGGRNEVELVARDYAGPLFDCRRSLADLNIEQQTVSSFVSQLAQAAGLTPQINITNDPIVGAITDNTAVVNNQVDTLWNIIIYLARMVGANAYTTPDRTLVFEDQTNNQTQHNFQWKKNPTQQQQGSADDSKPILDWHVLDQPGRNKNFTVICTSHHPQTTQTTTQTVTILGEDIQLPGKTKTQKAGTYRGIQGAKVRSALSANSLGIPIFQFPLKEGKKPAEVQAAADGYAKRIASKLVCMTIIVSGDVSLKPNDRVSIVDNSEDGDMLGFEGTPFWISAVSHHFNTPQGAIIGNDGFLTTLKLLNLPPAGAADGGDITSAIGG